MHEVSPATLLAKLESLAARFEAQHAGIAPLKAAAGSSVHDLETVADDRGANGTSSRRDLLRDGAVALGAAAASLAGRPAEAADGEPVIVGDTHTGTGSTWITWRDR